MLSARVPHHCFLGYGERMRWLAMVFPTKSTQAPFVCLITPPCAARWWSASQGDRRLIGGVCSFPNHKYSHGGQSQALRVKKGRVGKTRALEYLALRVLSSLHLPLSLCLLSGYLLSQREHSLYEAAERIMLVLGVPLSHHLAGLVRSKTFTNFDFPSVSSCPFCTPHPTQLQLRSQ